MLACRSLAVSPAVQFMKFITQTVHTHIHTELNGKRTRSPCYIADRSAGVCWRTVCGTISSAISVVCTQNSQRTRKVLAQNSLQLYLAPNCDHTLYAETIRETHEHQSLAWWWWFFRMVIPMISDRIRAGSLAFRHNSECRIRRLELV